ncbi:MAG: hypothetical protein IPK68_13120 [Bdellovibrionales bacterium]|nr:hypothetical protein [Bdellovibrionales bacterium]
MTLREIRSELFVNRDGRGLLRVVALQSPVSRGFYERSWRAIRPGFRLLVYF